MNSNMKKIIMIALSCFIFILNGCASGQAHIVVNQDGSADANILFSLGKDAKMYLGSYNPFTSVEEVLKQDGFTIQPYENTNDFGFNATKHLDTIGLAQSEAGVAHAAAPSISNDVVSYNTTQKERFFYTTYNFSGKVNVSTYYNDFLQTIGKQFKVAQVAPSFVANQLKENINLSVKVSLPVKAISSNAAKVSSDGKELEWKIDPTSENTLTMAVNVPNIQHIVIAASICFILLILVIVFLIRRRKA